MRYRLALNRLHTGVEVVKQTGTCKGWPHLVKSHDGFRDEIVQTLVCGAKVIVPTVGQWRTNGHPGEFWPIPEACPLPKDKESLSSDLR